MGLGLLSIIVFIETVCLIDGPWLGNKVGHKENTFSKATETSVENINKIVNRTKWRNVLRHIFRELKDSNKDFSSSLLSEQGGKQKVEIERIWFNRIN
jgi:predicted metallo-beta-lactamase superfamily hydrolase